jgi:hypothetical protein
VKFAPFNDRGVKAVFQSFPPGLRTPLLRLRQCILDTAAQTAAVGELIETLKWREPAYVPKKPRVGTTIRINGIKGSQDRYALYVHCQTSLIETFQHLYPREFLFQGSRALLFHAKNDIPEAPLKHCIAMALTYHRRSNA